MSKESFKLFAKNHPELAEKVLRGTVSWQQLYEIYEIYGENNSIWTNYIEKGEYSKIINITVYVLGGIFILASIVALFTPLFLPAQLNADISDAKPLCIFSWVSAILPLSSSKFFSSKSFWDSKPLLI